VDQSQRSMPQKLQKRKLPSISIPRQTRPEPSRKPSLNALEENTIQSIRSLEHRDNDGNIITDPDRSNPTRPRLERPLDTIRSFEAAIDGSYSRRSTYKADTVTPTTPQSNRRSGFFPGYQAPQRSPMDGGGYYGNRNGSSRPESYIDPYIYPPNQNGNGNMNAGGRSKFGPRTNSDPILSNHNNATAGFYPSHGHQQSYDTVASASNGSHATDQWGNSTDPSSENSSIDRVQAAAKPDIGETYGFNGFGAGPQIQGPILEEHGQGAPAYGQPGYGQGRVADRNGFPYQGNGAPTPPPHGFQKENMSRVPIQLGGSSGSKESSAVADRPAEPTTTEKRKSWLKKRFSRG